MVKLKNKRKLEWALKQYKKEKFKQKCLASYLKETITDHGTQFYANKRNKDGKAEHSFEKFLEENNMSA